MTGLAGCLGTRQGCLSRVLSGVEGQAAHASTQPTRFLSPALLGPRLKCGFFTGTHPGGLRSHEQALSRDLVAVAKEGLVPSLQG